MCVRNQHFTLYRKERSWSLSLAYTQVTGINNFKYFDW